ncbi:ser thr protein phosphatase family protein, partial [Chrysochromulina tobinii]
MVPKCARDGAEAVARDGAEAVARDGAEAVARDGAEAAAELSQLPAVDFEVVVVRPLPAPPSSSSPSQLTLCMVSDTHGYEVQGGRMPAADVLVHCGDWCNRYESHPLKGSLAKLDEWLASDRCSHIGLKIVLRGNHDAPTERSSRGHRTLPRSGALLVGNRPGPTLIEVGGLTLLAVPWDSKRDASTCPNLGVSRPTRAKHAQHGAKKPKPPTPLPRADVILSHAPPYGVLDVNQAGVRCGSAALLERVVAGCRASGALPPALWCFGHIHEGRGGEAVDLYQAAAAMRSAAKGHYGSATRFGTLPDALRVVAVARDGAEAVAQDGAEAGARDGAVPDALPVVAAAAPSAAAAATTRTT